MGELPTEPNASLRRHVPQADLVAYFGKQPWHKPDPSYSEDQHPPVPAAEKARKR